MARAGALALAFAACIAGGCTSLGERIAQPHSSGFIDAGTLGQMESVIGLGSARYLTPDDVTLSYGTIAPATRGMEYTISRSDGSRELAIRVDRETGRVPAKGSVVYLHGWGLDASSMLPWALALSELGYRGVTVDLRNHGRSSRAPAGFGTREAGDIAALVEHLQADGRLPPPIYLFGVSYGGATALFAEPLLRERITGVVVMETYANAGDGVRGVIAGMQARRADDGMRTRLMRAYTRWRYDAQDIERGVREAGRRLDLDLDTIDVRTVLATTATCTLLLHGARDRYIPIDVGRSLADASALVHYRELPDENHVSLPLRIEWLARPLDAWLQEVADGKCGPLQLPADPLADGGPSRFAVDDEVDPATRPNAEQAAHSPSGDAPAPSPPTDATHEHAIPR
ncbi:alpha/beta fold hydrolase [Luteimonas soli]|uniref:Alpha/beta fold hydrolase n=1 Tax=Luteimonas soli TaxID=1648966 RepID=A0ABV7XKI2_9GAMM